MLNWQQSCILEELCKTMTEDKHKAEHTIQPSNLHISVAYVIKSFMTIANRLKRNICSWLSMHTIISFKS
jgi:hypothetical protein